MDLLKQTKELCRIYNIKPVRSKGQNFLIKEEFYDKIIETADLERDETVLEVGPGLGFLTAKLAKRAKKVIAVELDDKLANALGIGLTNQNIGNVEIINNNILELGIRNHKSGMEIYNRKDHDSYFIIHDSKYKIVANLPYNITSVFLRKFLSEIENRPELMVLMLQKEVAERITARAGDMSLLAVSVQFYARPEIIQIVPKENFWPMPEIDSAIVKIIPHPSDSPLLIRRGEGGEADFFRLVRFGFAARRKMLKNNLAGGYHIGQSEAENMITRAGLDPKTRAQDISLDNWLKLFEEVKRIML